MKLPRPGLFGRTLLALVAVGLAPLLVVPYLIGLNRVAMLEQVQRAHALAARATAARAEAIVASLRNSGLALSHHPALTAEGRLRAVGELLSGLLQARPDVVALVVEDAAGAEVVRAQNKSLATSVAHMLALAGEGPVVSLREADALWLRIEVPLESGAGKLRMVADGRALRDAAQPMELGDGAEIVLADRSGAVVTASSAALDLAAFPAELQRAGRSGRISGSARTGTGAGLVLGAWAPVSGTDWFVLTQQPAAVAEAVAREMERRAVWGVAIALALAAALGGVAYVTVVRPMRELAQAQRRLALTRGSGRGSEIDQLRDSFKVLERQRHERDEMGRVFLGRYQVVELLGEGGMGSVFRGFDPKLRRPVALKTLRTGLADAGSRGEMASSLLREAITVARFNHPNIVAVYDVEDAPDLAFIAMEFVDGSSLERQLASGARMPAALAVPMAAHVTRGLIAAHAHGVVHHDVKPGNVLLGRDGSVKVTDFGIAEFVTALAKGSKTVFGTPGYLPPEALRGKGYDEAGDLFGVGVILYRCLAGVGPFAAKNPGEVVRKTLAGHVSPLREKVPDLHARVDELVRGLLRERAQRAPSTGVALLAVLEAICEQEDWHWEFPAGALAPGSAASPSGTPAPPESGLVQTIADLSSRAS